MATETIQVSALVSAKPEQVYAAWLDSAAHGKMTGSEALIDPTVHGRHSAWGGYIVGETLELDPDRRIVQSWRTSEFPEGSADSRVVVTFDEEGGQTRVTIAHSEIPEGQGARYEAGWSEFYFQPMTAYFENVSRGPEERPAAKKPAVKKAAAKKTTKKAAKKTAKKAAKKAAAKKTAKKAAKKSARKAPAKKRARKSA
jgi:uncharacterized protein YndB with AHSA1/START domain